MSQIKNINILTKCNHIEDDNDNLAKYISQNAVCFEPGIRDFD